MDEPNFESGQPIPLSAVAPELLGKVGPDAPERAKFLTAKAIVPMAPEQLGWALAVLARDENAEVAAEAQKSLLGLPEEIRSEILGSTAIPGEVFDVFAHLFRDDDSVLRLLVSHPQVLDETVRWIGRNLKGVVLDAIANNQVRLLRAPRVTEALIANPACPTPVLARVVETVLRGEVDTSEIRGFKDLADAFFADLAEQKNAESKAASAVKAAIAIKELEAGALEAAASAGVKDSVMEVLLSGGSQAEEAVDEKGKKLPLWRLIDDMTVAQKIRLTNQGNAECRRLLIKDPKKVISMAVLRSAKVTEKEIANFAHDKSLAQEIIAMIARNREWTKSYPVKVSLLWNPKCPAQKVGSFLLLLKRKDLTSLSRAKDVPAHVTRAAKQLKEKRGW